MHYHYTETPWDKKGEAFKLHAFTGLNFKELGLLVKGISRDLSTEQFYNNPKIRKVIKSILLERVKSEIEYFKNAEVTKNQITFW